MTHEYTIDEYMAKAQTFKVEALNWEDFPPTLDYGLVDGDHHMVPNPVDPLDEIAMQAITVRILGDIDHVFAVCDMLRRSDGQPTVVGTLPERWDNGDRDGITENLVIMKITKDGFEARGVDYNSAEKAWVGDVRDITGEYDGDSMVKALRLGCWSINPDGEHSPDIDEKVEGGRKNPVLRAGAMMRLGRTPDPADIIATLQDMATRGVLPSAQQPQDRYHSVRLTDYIRKD